MLASLVLNVANFSIMKKLMEKIININIYIYKAVAAPSVLQTTDARGKKQYYTRELCPTVIMLFITCLYPL